jgi:hypothetical protein
VEVQLDAYDPLPVAAMVRACLIGDLATISYLVSSRKDHEQFLFEVATFAADVWTILWEDGATARESIDDLLAGACSATQ